MGVAVSRFYEFGRFYVYRWKLPVVFMTPDGAPLHAWREYAERGMTVEEYDRLYAKLAQRIEREERLRISVLTGEFMAGLETPMVIVDVDSPPVRDFNEKLELMKYLARENYLVVNTPRGFHVHAFLTKDDKVPYVVRLEREEGERVSGIGEGACLQPHTWTMPPSTRPMESSWFTYSFVYPDGTLTSSYSKFASNPIEPKITSFTEFASDIETALRCRVRVYAPMAAGAAPELRRLEVGEGKAAVFHDLEEFLATSTSLVLPRCVAWVLYNYFYGVGDDLRATLVLSPQEEPEELMVRVPHGRRFLVSVAVSLFLAHVVERVNFSEIVEVLSHSIEDFPRDEGAPIDRKLRYYLLADEEGNVYPRYSGLGSMNLVQVLGDFCTERCFYGRACRGRNPWRAFRKTVRIGTLARQILEPLPGEGYQ
ncbi:MAG: hypothetical protein QW324_05095 [Thermofilaceae archaeon]